MQNELSTLEQVTCYAIILALALAVIKQFSYPLSRMFMGLNPIRNRKFLNNLSDRVEECEMEKYTYNEKLENLSQGLYYNEDNFKKLKSEIEKLKSIKINKRIKKIERKHAPKKK